LAIDSTHVKAWSIRKTKDKTKPEYKEAKNCEFARLGRTPKGFDICYRIHIATETKTEIPIAVKVFPGNIHDRKAFQKIFTKALQHTKSKPLVISADKGYSSGTNRSLVDSIQAMCIIRPGKNDLMKKTIKNFLPVELSEKQYWKLYTRRLAVERTFGRTKGYFGLYRPRVTGKTAVTQHVFLSFICHLLAVEVSQALKLIKISVSMFV
jgi:transposase